MGKVYKDLVEKIAEIVHFDEIPGWAIDHARFILDNCQKFKSSI